jgi:CRISPR-associated protein Cmr1
MKTLAYTLTFLTPAFLGGAEQSGRWRTPPVKALLRQWWRVAYAADHGFKVDVDTMRREEGLLFGNAWLENEFRKSQVRIRLNRWDEGGLERDQWSADVSITHPEVKNREGKLVPVGSALYMGYGPLTYDNYRRATSLKANAAIQVEAEAKLSLAVPEEHAPRIQRALWLLDRYGTLGGRSRNGWGSFSLYPLPLGEGWGEGMTPPVRPWRDCLDRDWPHAVGKDDKGPLVWQTAKAYDDWKALMRELAIIKIGLRTQFVFPSVAPPHPQPLERHWLSYPITRHTTQAFDRNARLPNTLRFKVRRTSDSKLVGVIFHAPCKPPSDFRPVPTAIQRTWETVHQLLDELTMTSVRTYSMVTDASRRAQLKPNLDKVVLERISE